MALQDSVWQESQDSCLILSSYLARHENTKAQTRKLGQILIRFMPNTKVSFNHLPDKNLAKINASFWQIFSGATMQDLVMVISQESCQDQCKFLTSY